jgi:hypothetical protein
MIRIACAALVLAACGSDHATLADAAIDADPAIDAAPPREIIMTVQPLAAGELVEGIMTGGPSDRAVIHLDGPSATIDWNLHGHAGGGTQMIYEELAKMSVEYSYVPSASADWFVLIRNGGPTNMEVQVRVELFGAMAWRWQ